MHLLPTNHWHSDTVELFLLGPEHVSAAYVGWMNNPVVNRYLESRYAAHTEASVRCFVSDMLASSANLFLGIRSVALGGRHVGNIKLGPIDLHHDLGEIGLLVGEPQAWGQGIASAAIAQLALIARDQLHLRKLSAGCYASNRGSARAFVKAGFSVEATRPQHFLVNSQPEDLILLGRLL